MNHLKINYIGYFLRIALIVLSSEFIIMLMFGYFDLEKNISHASSAFLDAAMLLTITIYPIYQWVYTPFLERLIAKHHETEMLAEALHDAGDSVIITSTEGSIMYINEAFTSVTGYAREEVIGQNPNILSSGKQDKMFYKRMWQSLSTKGFWKGELWNKRKNGELYPEALDIRAVKKKNGKVKFYVGVFSDLTEQKSAEHALLQSQKLEAVGTLVGGVAHNFNNFLAAISGKAYLAERSNDKEKIINNLKDIQKLSFDSAELVRQLLTFARETEHEKKNISIVEMLKEAIKTSQLGIPENIDVEVSLPDSAAMINGDSVHLQQAIINIINNAKDAVLSSQNKKISISMQIVNRTDCKFSSQCHCTYNQMSQISISDSGSGINSADLDHIFEPFFTTKTQGLGTGLGLSTSMGTIHDHGGTINVKSKYTKGTTFTICLRVAEASNAKVEPIQQLIHAEKSSTILVVDDDEQVRSTTVEILQSLGYQTVEAVNGQDALDKFAFHQGSINLVITDMVMPKMGGADLASNIRKLDKSAPILFITGYDLLNHPADNILKSDYTMTLNKPFTPIILSHMINDLLLGESKKLLPAIHK